MIPAIAECMELPLVRLEFHGTSVQRTVDYDDTKKSSEDEVEKLYELLVEVKKKFPEVEAVSSGAILSDYQRNRVENV